MIAHIQSMASHTKADGTMKTEPKINIEIWTKPLIPMFDYDCHP